MNIKEYLERYGIKQCWFADQIGMNRRAFNVVVQGRRQLPKKYWRKTLELSFGEITIGDLLKLKELYEEFYEGQNAAPKPNVQGGDHSKLP